MRALTAHREESSCLQFDRLFWVQLLNRKFGDKSLTYQRPVEYTCNSALGA